MIENAPKKKKSSLIFHLSLPLLCRLHVDIKCAFCWSQTSIYLFQILVSFRLFLISNTIGISASLLPPAERIRCWWLFLPAKSSKWLINCPGACSVSKALWESWYLEDVSEKLFSKQMLTIGPLSWRMPAFSYSAFYSVHVAGKSMCASPSFAVSGAELGTRDRDRPSLL